MEAHFLGKPEKANSYHPLKAICRSFESARDGIAAGITLDAVMVDLHDALNALSEMTGERYDDDILNRIFSDFCIGK
ncbi:hypothetical protein [Desulfatirhabdium butyrativorans]|uniref:hypothetical protein n=1 Tax=Desulfatirhabdium butyrativorans TaxID=340467 RepID=UPI000A02E982